MYARLLDKEKSVGCYRQTIKKCDDYIKLLTESREAFDPNTPFQNRKYELYSDLINEQINKKNKLKQKIENLSNYVKLEIYSDGLSNVYCIYGATNKSVDVKEGNFRITIDNYVSLYGYRVGDIIVYGRNIKSFVYVDDFEVTDRYDFYVVSSAAPSTKLNYKSPGYLSSIIKNLIIQQDTHFVSIFKIGETIDERVATYKICNGCIYSGHHTAANVEIISANGQINTKVLNLSAPITMTWFDLNPDEYGEPVAEVAGNSDLGDLKKILTEVARLGLSLWDLPNGQRLRFNGKTKDVHMGGKLVTKFQLAEDRIVVETE